MKILKIDTCTECPYFEARPNHNSYDSYFPTCNNPDTEKIQSFISEETAKMINLYQQCLLKVIWQIPDFKSDLMHIFIDRDLLTEHIYYNGAHIGDITHKSGHNNDDFIHNKISFVVQFTPKVK